MSNIDTTAPKYMPTSSSANPLKILFAVLICLLFVFSLLIYGGVYWITKAVGQNARPEIEAPFPRQNRAAQNADGPLLAAAPIFPKAATKNAILAARTNDLPGDDIFRDLLIPRLKINIPR